MFYYTNKRKRNKKILLIAGVVALAIALVFLIVLFANTIASWFGDSSGSAETTGTPTTSAATPEPTPQKPLDESGLTVATRFGTPEGFKRVTVEKGSFGEFLRNYSLKAYGTVPKFKSGGEVEAAATMGVLNQILLSDNQTSPRAVMFLYAQYLYEREAYALISFDFYTTPVFHFDYATWMTGQRVKVEGSKVEWYTPEGAEASEPTEENFQKYMKFAMAYANTYSLKNQLNHASFTNLQVGDVIIENKHALIVLDICRNETTGEIRFICAEGSKDGVSEMYLLQDAGTQSVWLTLEENGTFVYNGDVYTAEAVRRF